MKLRKLTSVITILLICLILLVSASYAWITISRTPEITGIDTQIGANGSLAIALLSDKTYLDPSGIRAGVGDSLELDPTSSNLTWGNVIDLSDESYGLGQISMLPSRLNVSAGEQNVVSSNMLSVPSYGLDGRFGSFAMDTVSSTFSEGKFIYYAERQGYGVRGIGTITDMSLQQSALAGAKSLVKSYSAAASAAAKSVWTSNGAFLFDICYRKYYLNLESFNNSDVAAIRDTATRLMNALSYIDLALRQGIIGYASSTVENESDLKTLRTTVENTSIPLSMMVDMLPADLPSGFSKWIDTVDNDRLAMYGVITACDRLRGDRYTWEIISPLLGAVMNTEEVFVGQDRLASITPGTLLPVDAVLTMTPEAGVMADIADYAGNYSTFFSYTDTTSVEAVTMSTVSKAYLAQVSEALDKLEPAGDGIASSSVLEDVYGFAVDLAFQSNLPSDLLLQTEPELRVDNDSQGADIQGGGSYMRFSSEDLSEEQIVYMMDAIRLAFLDNRNNLLGIAKLNTSNYTVGENGVIAPLYLYDFAVSPDGSLSMGERQKKDNVITSLTAGIPNIVTVVVWLDGDHVDNSLAANGSKSMEGALNLQFAGSGTLHSANLDIRPSESD